MKFLISFILFSILFLASLAALIISVDPYDKLGNNPFGFETKAVAQSRENKFIMFDNSKEKYEAVILGSSTAHRIPTQIVQELTNLKTFNYSAQHTSPEDYLAIIRHIISKNIPRHIFLQIGFIEMNKNYKTDNRLYNSSLNKFLTGKQSETLFDNNYFTLDAIRDSLRVIYVNKFGEALHSNYTEDGNYKKETLKPGPVKFSQAGYGAWELDQKRVGFLREIKQMCIKNKIALTVFTAPLSYPHILLAQKAQGYQEYIAVMKKTFGSFWDFHHISLKPYDTYKEFQNSSHPTKEFSAEMMRRMITGKGLSIGIYR